MKNYIRNVYRKPLLRTRSYSGDMKENCSKKTKYSFKKNISNVIVHTSQNHRKIWKE